MQNLNTYGDISPRTAVKAAKRLLRVAQIRMVTQRFGQADDQEKNSSKVRKWRRYELLPPAVAPLAEGITPQGLKISYTDYMATLQQYGAVINLTDVIEDTHEDPVLKTFTDRCATQAAQTIEIVTFDILKGGTNVQYAGGVLSRAAVATGPTRADLRVISRTMNRTRAEKISQVITASEKISTSGVPAAYFAMLHTDLLPDMRVVTGWKNAVEYSNPNEPLPYEEGAVDEFRFIFTQECTPFLAAGASTTTMLSNGTKPTTSSAADVYPILIVGKDAYGIVRLQGMNAAKIYVKNPNEPTKDDPLAQRGTIGWKIWFSAAILNELWIVRYEVCANATPQG